MLSPVSTWMGDHWGTMGAVDNLCLIHLQKVSTAPSVPWRSPIEVLTGLTSVYLTWSQLHLNLPLLYFQLLVPPTVELIG